MFGFLDQACVEILEVPKAQKGHAPVRGLRPSAWASARHSREKRPNTVSENLSYKLSSAHDRAELPFDPA